MFLEINVSTYRLCSNGSTGSPNGLNLTVQHPLRSLSLPKCRDDISLKSENTRGKGAEVEEDQTEDKTEAGKPSLH